MAARMQADHDAAQGPDHWKKVLAWSFERFSQPCGYTVGDLSAITAPTLILVGDRDPFCSIEEGVTRLPRPARRRVWRAGEHSGRELPQPPCRQ